jgi:hypothetical protein
MISENPNAFFEIDFLSFVIHGDNKSPATIVICQVLATIHVGAYNAEKLGRA